MITIMSVIRQHMKTVEFDHTKFINITDDNYEMSDNMPTTDTVWRSILSEHDIPDNLPENKKSLSLIYLLRLSQESTV